MEHKFFWGTCSRKLNHQPHTRAQSAHSLLHENYACLELALLNHYPLRFKLKMYVIQANWVSIPPTYSRCNCWFLQRKLWSEEVRCGLLMFCVILRPCRKPGFLCLLVKQAFHWRYYYLGVYVIYQLHHNRIFILPHRDSDHTRTKQYYSLCWRFCHTSLHVYWNCWQAILENWRDCTSIFIPTRWLWVYKRRVIHF